MEEAPKIENLENRKEEIRRTAELVKDRIDSMLSRIDSVSEDELLLIQRTINDANFQFDEMAGRSIWREALIKSAPK